MTETVQVVRLARGDFAKFPCTRLTA